MGAAGSLKLLRLRKMNRLDFSVFARLSLRRSFIAVPRVIVQANQLSPIRLSANAREKTFPGHWLKCTDMRDRAGSLVQCPGDGSPDGISDRGTVHFR
jgi:hypothetical protein